MSVCFILILFRVLVMQESQQDILDGEFEHLPQKTKKVRTKNTVFHISNDPNRLKQACNDGIMAVGK